MILLLDLLPLSHPFLHLQFLEPQLLLLILSLDDLLLVFGVGVGVVLVVMLVLVVLIAAAHIYNIRGNGKSNLKWDSVRFENIKFRIISFLL